NHGFRFAVADVAWGRTNEFRDFMALLELRAIDFGKCVSTTKKDLRCSLDNPGFSRSRRSKKTQIGHLPIWAGHTCAKCLVNSNQLTDRLILSDDLFAKTVSEFRHFRTSLQWIEIDALWFHVVSDFSRNPNLDRFGYTIDAAIPARSRYAVA